MDTDQQSQLEIVVSHSPLAFIYQWFTPTVTINESSYRRAWGTHLFQVPAGECQVSVSYPWLFLAECGKNTVHLSLNPGETRRVTYCAGLIRYLPGKMHLD